MEKSIAARAAEEKRNFLQKEIGFSLSQPVNARPMTPSFRVVL
jgi:hypothetical protein